MISAAVLREKNSEARTSYAVKTQVRIFTEKMQTVSRDIPELLTSRDIVLVRLNTLHGIVVKLAKGISTPKPYRNALPTKCKNSVVTSFVVARETKTEESFLYSTQCLAHVSFLRDFISLYALNICQRLLKVQL